MDAISDKDLNRSLVVRIGKRLRKWINPYLRSRSRIGDAPVFHPEHFLWLRELEENWTTIRDEAQALMSFRSAIPPLSDISPDHARLDSEKKWRAYFLWGYGFKSEENCERCPRTAEIIRNIPGLSTAMFSIHEPGMKIAPHAGVTAGVCVVHLGLKVPAKRENCAIRVENEIISWDNGVAFAFDDTYEHETWNNTDEDRIILLLHVRRPLPFPASFVAWLFMTGIRWSPFIGDARRKMKSWDSKFRKLEKEDRG